LLYRFYLATLCALLACRCNLPPHRLQTGHYNLIFQLKDARVPIRLTVSASTWTIHNADEVIPLTPMYLEDDSFFVEMPLFQTFLCGRIKTDSTMEGNWLDPTRTTLNSIPFTIQKSLERPAFNVSKSTTNLWDCTFSPGHPTDASKAIGVFQTDGLHIQATFMTETGDFRYLEGNQDGDHIQLSCFDGTHLFHFNATQRGDSITDGTFLSGVSWKESWNAALNPNAELRHPDSLTTMTDSKALRFQALNMENQMVTFDSTDFLGKVTIVQIFGSWCPNCTDESKFLKDIYAAYGNQNLQIIPVAYEREASVAEQIKRIKRQFNDLGLTYAPYLGGTSPKSNAQTTFSQLNHVMSYPTAIIIDKKAQVRKIHTGFYGPGTGPYHLHHKEKLQLFIDQLLREN
jgi:thiol-disulfide isomerase/thioredoxin